MKLIDNILYLEFNDLVESGVSENTLFKAKERVSPSWTFINDPVDRRKVLIQYDKLKDKYKKLVQMKFGDPNEFMSFKPIKELVQTDFEAEKYYLSYEYEPGKRLPIGENGVNYPKKYTTSASWLNMLLRVDDNKSIIKNDLNIKHLSTFFENVSRIIDAEKIDLPTRYQPMRNRMAEYREKGYECLIDWRFGNNLSLKIKDELSESVLLDLIAHPNQYDDVLVCRLYNEWAGKNNYKQVVPGTIANWRRKRNHEIIIERKGREVYNNTMRRKVMRSRPSAPCLLWESDDNHLDWWFQGDKAQEFRKIKGIIVTDSFNDYVLGYAITDGEMPEATARLAYLNAMYHIRELTGGWYLPYEVKTDQWNINQLKPFYQGIGHYYDTPVGSKNRGWLENFFGHIDWERSMKIGNNNYTGHNITAATPGVNIEAVKQSKKVWPHISEASSQMQEMITRLRTVPRNYDESKKSRQQEWLEAWTAMPEDKKILISEEQFLLKFGFRHNWQNTITDQGIRPTIMGSSFAYSVPPALYMPNVGKKVDVIYDPYDMSRVLVTDNANLRFIARSMTPVAGCMADMQDGGRTFLNKILDESKADAEQYGKKKDRRKELLLENGIDTESIIKLGGKVIKEIKQQAELEYQLNEIENKNYNPYANL